MATARGASKSPKRHIELTALENAYGDPTERSRTILPAVFFERHDEQTLTLQATRLFNNRTVFADENERSWLLSNMCCTKIYVKVGDTIHTINGIHCFKKDQPFVLILHGFGAIASWSNWIKTGYPFEGKGGYSVLFVDLPGFGRSSGRDLNQTSWKQTGPEIILGILSSFHLQQSIHTVSHCGGAGTTVRTLNRYPGWFRNRGLFFSNTVIGDFGEKTVGEFENNLVKFNIHITVYWIPDRDHTKQCIAYKRWNRLRQTGFRHLQLVDLDPKSQTMKLSYPPVTVPNMSRCAAKNKAHVYKLSDEFIEKIFNCFTEK